MTSIGKIWAFLLELTDAAAWITGVLVILGLCVVLHWSWRRLHKRIHSKLEQTQTVWDDAFWEALSRPVAVAIWVLGLLFAIEHIATARAEALLRVTGTLRTVGVVVLLGWFLMRLVRASESRLIHLARNRSEDERLDSTTIEAVAKLARIIVVVLMALVGMQSLGFSIHGLLAFGGIGGLAVSFAAKDLLANFFGGLILYLDRPFVVGDTIRSPDRELEGTVEYIGWRQTRIRTDVKRPLYVPNSVFANIAVENISRMSNRRIKELIGLRYQDADQLPALLTDIRALLSGHPDIDPDQTQGAWFHQFGESSLNLLVDAHTRAVDVAEFYRIKESVLFGIAGLVAKHGADFAFPSRTVYLESGASPALD